MFPHVPVNYVISNTAGSRLSLLSSTWYCISLTSSATKPYNQQMINDSAVAASFTSYIMSTLKCTLILSSLTVLDCVLNTKLRKNGDFFDTLEMDWQEKEIKIKMIYTV